jgi:hypothetical protein
MFASIVLLGAFHGINPGMGWLFAVALGLQAGNGRAVLRALGPLALGHAFAIAAALAVAAALGIVLPLAWLRWVAASALLGIGAFSLLRHVHPRGGGMRVGAKALTIWSFLVSSAHGAGLMVLPFALRLFEPQVQSPHASHLTMATLGNGQTAGVVATLLHTASYLAVTGAIAWLVYKKLGLRLLRSAWINVNQIWAVALIVTAVVTAFV